MTTHEDFYEDDSQFKTWQDLEYMEILASIYEEKWSPK